MGQGFQLSHIGVSAATTDGCEQKLIDHAKHSSELTYVLQDAGIFGLHFILTYAGE